MGGANADGEGEGDVTARCGLAARLAARIRRDGKLSVAAFMTMALHDPEQGYYARRDPIGRAGDFITAPEVSQIFGELIGLCLADWWQRAGRPRPFILAELGPGSGTLMADLLRAAATVADFRGALQLHLVEASRRLREAQQRRLGAARPQFAVAFDDLPTGPLLLVANEFLDALPIRQFVRGRAEWAERLVGLDADDRLVFAPGPESRAATLLVPEHLRGEPAGTIVEICPAAAALAAALGARFTAAPGLALFVDYGHRASRPGATLAAVRRHAAASVLDDPGDCDLSAHVDFAAFAAAARAKGALVHGPVPQRQFLLSLGAEQRLAALAANATPAQREALQSGLNRLIAPEEMGTLFQVLALTSPGLPAPSGFA
ncbi:MAG TPA: SAM-dependent methyltransferase [Stellaceae bacterium]|nr:SAM-dependent methyltransferase [Stellaceae bacterium]